MVKLKEEFDSGKSDGVVKSLKRIKVIEGMKLYFLVGTTAMGKTEISQKWALRMGAEIVSCDALVVYKGMDIGTAKPSKEQMKVRHHLIDEVSIREIFSVKKYVDRAWEAIQSILSRGKKVLIVGGSGFYLKSYFEAVFDDYQMDGSVRKYIQNLYEQKGLKGIVEELKRRNREGTGSLDLLNPRRVMRGLERCLISGKDIVSLEKAFSEKRSRFFGFEKKVYRLVDSEQLLKKRIVLRTQSMLERGLIEEVKSLIKMGLEENPTTASAIGYKEVIQWIKEGEKDKKVLSREIEKSTFNLVKKQNKWFKNQLQVDEEIDLEKNKNGEEFLS